MKWKFGKSYKLIHFQVKESPTILFIFEYGNPPQHVAYPALSNFAHLSQPCDADLVHPNLVHPNLVHNNLMPGAGGSGGTSSWHKLRTNWQTAI